jgi:hypothetical protein
VHFQCSVLCDGIMMCVCFQGPSGAAKRMQTIPSANSDGLAGGERVASNNDGGGRDWNLGSVSSVGNKVSSIHTCLSGLAPIHPPAYPVTCLSELTLPLMHGHLRGVLAQKA